MIVNICGVPHEVIECEDNFSDDLHLGIIDFKNAIIKINGSATKEIKEETICHEVIHGILVHIGRDELSQDETFVQSLSNAIFQSFTIKDTGSEPKPTVF